MDRPLPLCGMEEYLPHDTKGDPHAYRRLGINIVKSLFVQVAPASISRWLIRNGYRFKKSCWPASKKPPHQQRARQEWRDKRQPRMRLEPHRRVFIDETGTTTKMTRLRGRCLKGQRLRSKAPFGHWKTQTFIAGLRCHGLTAPFVIHTPINLRRNAARSDAGKGDVVILDNLAAHKSPAAETAIRARGALAALPAALQPRSQSHRNGIRQAQTAPARKGSEPSTSCGRPLAMSAISSRQQNAETTSQPQGMDSHESPPL
ncbi:transposase [Mesorhizobium sp. M0146]|uniref:transposase n=1 Tax=unclassified Mesorhizobium TaxID=325217 RepID=UPI00333DE46C